METELAYTNKEAAMPHLHGISLRLYSLKMCKEKLLLLVCLSNHRDALSSLITIMR